MFRYLIILLSILISACGGGSRETDESNDTNTVVEDIDLSLSVVSAVPQLVGNISNVDFIFSSSGAGALSIEGKCSTGAVSVLKGNNTISFNNLETETYDDCQLTVTSDSSVQAVLQVPSFTVDNTPPEIGLVNSLRPHYSNNSPIELTIESNDTAKLKIDGLCNLSGELIEGENSILLEGLDVGDHHNCKMVATDSFGNKSVTVNIPAFFVQIAELPYIALQGEDDSIMSVNSPEATLSVSSDRECNWEEIEKCPSGKALNIIENSSLIELQNNLSRDAFYTLKIGGQRSLVSSSQETDEYFESLSGHEVVRFQSKLWVFGGSKSGPNNEVWSSEDGIHWQQETPHTVFSARSGHKVIEFNEKLWLIGGRYYNQDLNDLWSSSDGIDWQEEHTDKIFSPREGFDAVSFNDRLWLIGGKEGFSNYLNDIWFSTDGVNWEKATENAAFPGRKGHKVAEFNGKIWLIAGQVQSGFSPYANDIWSSVDGVTWVQELDSAPFSARSRHDVISFGNRLWVIGGGNSHLDVWSSSNGIDWKEEIEATPLTQTQDHELVVFQNKIWLIGGNSWSPDESYKNDVWSSTNGVSWNRESSEPDLPKVSKHQSTIFNNRIYVTQNKYLWSSEDGASWTNATTDSGFGNRANAQLISFNNKLWLYGGTSDTSNSFWSSDDGSEWTRVRDTQSLFNRAGHQMLVHDSKLWLFGGAASAAGDDVWFSNDGISWEEVVYGTRFTSRYGHQAVFFQNKFWLIGGYSGVNAGEIWSSEDGADWTLENENAVFGPRLDHQVIVFKNKLWLIGGRQNSLKNDIWSSVDGTNWVLEVESASFSPRVRHQLEVYKEKLWMIGGRDSSNLNEVWVSENGTEWRKLSRGKFVF